MRRLKPRIYTPPRREKNTPPPQINLHPPRNSRNFFGFFFTNFMSAVSISQNLTGTSHFLRKSSPAAGNIAFLIRTMHFHPCIDFSKISDFQISPKYEIEPKYFAEMRNETKLKSSLNKDKYFCLE